ncbi:MAG: LysM peptidoglycan-binding domain-containing protein [Pseudophaeobacter sp.]|uniref:LysM peptidoglycan-binding domain-containing protein n=1 Tax=Pseudophaeobacter sp. TaxID=1971739 RepID=UPI0032D8D77F
MAGTGVTGGLSSLALGGTVATVVVVGGATMAWLGVFDTSQGTRATRDDGSKTVAISPSATPPVVIEGLSQKPDPAVDETAAPTSDGAEAQQLASADTPEVNDATGAQTGTTAEAALGDEPEQSAALAAPEPETTTQAVAQGQNEIADQSAEAPLFDAPMLDLVRVGPSGETVIAGRATPGLLVEVLLDGAVIEQVEVPAGGDFAALAQLPPSTQARVISLRASARGQERFSDSSFIVAPAAPLPAVNPAPVVIAEAAPQSGQVAAATTQGAETTVAEAPSEEPAQHAVTSAEETAGATVATAPETAAIQAEANQDAVTLAQESQAQETLAQETQAKETPAQDTLSQDTLAQENPPESTELQEGGLTAQVPQGIASGAPRAPDSTAPAAVVASPEPRQVADATTAVAQPDATNPGSAEQATVAQTEPAPQPKATQVAVLRADADGVTLVQPIAQKPQGKVVLDTISYSDSGEVQLAGRAGAASNILVYLDNTPAGQFAAAENGNWGGALEAVEPGVYTLRLDEVNDAGKVLSRMETPFKREAPEVLQPPVAEGASGEAAPLVRAVTVQEGDTLWAISQQRYGSGFLYVRVFEANNSAIRDPDLIYPGQVFTLPE